VVLFAAVDVRRSSERAGSALDAALAAEDFSAAAERALALHEALPERAAGSRSSTDLSKTVDRLQPALSDLRSARPGDPDLIKLAEDARAAETTVARLADPDATPTGSSYRLAREEAGTAISALVALAGPASNRFTTESRDADGEARRRLGWEASIAFEAGVATTVAWLRETEAVLS